MRNTDAHIIAMTGSYFRGDAAPVLAPEDEEKFAKITYNYYEQLNGYTYLKSLGIGYHFYQGRYTAAVPEVLDTDKKTILHIPHVGSGESLKDKIGEVDSILDSIGEVVSQDPKTGVINVKRIGGRQDHQGRGSRHGRAGAAQQDRRVPADDGLGRRHRPDHRAGHGEGRL